MAKSYLQKAGNPGGFTFTAMTSNDLDATSSAQAIAVQSQLTQAGITMNIQNLAGNAYIQDWLKGKFQAAFAENGADPNPYTMYGRYFAPGAEPRHPGRLQQRRPTAASSRRATRRPRLPLRRPSSRRSPPTSPPTPSGCGSSTATSTPRSRSNVHGFSLPPTRDLNSIAKATVS